MDGFEWDEEKRRRNNEKHEIDFLDAAVIFNAPFLEFRSSFPFEERWVAIGMLAVREIAVIYTPRNGIRRIISVRRARPNERRWYHANVHGGHPEGAGNR